MQEIIQFVLELLPHIKAVFSVLMRQVRSYKEALDRILLN